MPQRCCCPLDSATILASTASSVLPSWRLCLKLWGAVCEAVSGYFEDIVVEEQSGRLDLNEVGVQGA